MAAELVKQRSQYGAWCDQCKDGINRATLGKAATWVDAHNEDRHKEES